MANGYRPMFKYEVGDQFEAANPEWGRVRYMVVQILPDLTQVLYRMNHNSRSRNNDRWYLMGGPGRPGIRRDSNT